MIPSAEYQSRLADRRGRAAVQDRHHITMGNIRLMVGILTVSAAYAAFVHHAINPLWIFAPVAAFLPLIPWHSRILRRRALAQRAGLFYERGLARLEDRWAGSGEEGLAFQEPNHPYAEDLDLFGPASLFELLSQARTRAGEAKLAQWLQHPADPDILRQRHEAVAELRPLLDLRETIFTLGEDARDSVQTGHLIHWAESASVLHSAGLWVAAACITVAVAAGGAAAHYTPYTAPFAIALVVAAAFGYVLRPRVLSVITRVDEAVHDLGLLVELLRIVEAHPFTSQNLVGLRQRLTASEPIGKLHRLAELIDSRDNPALRALGPPLLYGTHLAFAVERWRAAHGTQVRSWLEALSEFEALLSLAGYSYEHPADPFPEIVAAKVLDGEELGHPLLPGCVRNSIHLDEKRQLLCVSGSNMSGKSTFLRTVGINVALAMAGAPVRAKRLTLCPFATGAALRVTDSLQGGASRFYAELKRLRQVVDLTTAPVPVLFLLDELLSGTNSHDRKIGAEGIIRELLNRGAIGLITTHDLALTAIATSLEPRALNVHFEDHLEGGQLRFDYILRPGVVKKSNALELMRSIGLDV